MLTLINFAHLSETICAVSGFFTYHLARENTVNFGEKFIINMLI